MKKLYVIFLSLLAIFIISSSCLASIRTVYPSNEPIMIKTKLDTQTYINFKTSIVTASIGNADLFSAVTDNMTNKVKLTPKKVGAFTNLIIFTADGSQYEFWLEEVGNNNEFDGIVNIESNLDIQIADMISLINKRKVSIDPAIKNLVKFYEITEPTFTNYQDMKITLKRAVTISNLNKTIYWLRIENTSDKNYTLPDQPKDKKQLATDEYCIPLNSIMAKDRVTGWVAVESNKEKLLNGEFTDLYLIVHGDYTDSSLHLNFTCNNKAASVSIDNIPYSKQDFRVFIVEDNQYTSVSIEDYWR